MLTVIWQNYFFGPCPWPFKLSIDFPEDDAHKTSMESNGVKIFYVINGAD